MRCPSCGGELPPWSRYCSWCGALAPGPAWGPAPGSASEGWRRDGGGWILLHLVIGLLGLWTIQLLVLGLALGAADGSLTVHPAHLVPAGSGLAGWFLFVYLRADLASRLTALAASVLFGLAVAFALSVRLQG